ncbi:MAG: FtsQ-type POTRA domain-containing protein [Acidobacteriia bacterium]|nr:FtsQ-type POTRA domain-containing protein [Terriglobia bacterium]
MSAPRRHRHPVRRFLRRALPALVTLAATATLAVALQVREVRVVGARRFAARDVESVLRSALGSPTVATRASALRAKVRAVPWVEDATVRVSLDGVVTCAVVERVPVAVEVDAGVRQLVDREGRLLATIEAASSLLRLEGFGPFPEERETLLAVVPTLEGAWGGKLERVERVGPHDVALHFAEISAPVLADPGRPEELVTARRVFTAWTAKRSVPLRLDARLAGRVAVLPGQVAPEGES